MPDCKFKCLNCGQQIEAPYEMLGQLIDCPACKKTVEVSLQPGLANPRPTKPNTPSPTVIRATTKWLEQKIQSHNAMKRPVDVDVPRRSNWAGLWFAIGIVCVVISIAIIVFGIINEELEQAITYSAICLAAGLQALLFSFLIDVFTDIRWYLMLLVKK